MSELNGALPAEVANGRSVEEERRHNEQLLRGLFESAPDTIVLVTAAGTIERINQQARAMFGYAPAELIGQPVEILIPERFRAQHVGHRATYSHQPKARPMGAGLESSGRRKDGSQFPVDIMLSPLETEQGTLIVAVVRDITRRRRTEETLRQLSLRLLRLQDEERRRIARELHDSTGQKLAAIAMNLDGSRDFVQKLDPVGRKIISDTLGLVDDCVREIRTLSYLLHPPLLDERGLVSALRWYVKGFMERSGVQVDLQVTHELPRLSQEVETTLFRIVQESLANIHRHANSSTAEIRLDLNQDQVSLEVRDAGKGLPEPRADEDQMNELGVGIAGMRERVKQLAGQMDIKSNSHGTLIHVTLPIAGAAA